MGICSSEGQVCQASSSPRIPPNAPSHPQNAQNLLPKCQKLVQFDIQNGIYFQKLAQNMMVVMVDGEIPANYLFEFFFFRCLFGWLLVLWTAHVDNGGSDSVKVTKWGDFGPFFWPFFWPSLVTLTNSLSPQQVLTGVTRACCPKLGPYPTHPTIDHLAPFAWAGVGVANEKVTN